MNITDFLQLSPLKVYGETFCTPVQYSTDLGMYYSLDTNYASLSFDNNVRNMKKIFLYIKSASAITGDIVLNIKVNESIVVLGIVVSGITADWTQKTIILENPLTGYITIERDTTNALDTLKDTDTVSAIIGTDIFVENV